MLLVLSDRNSTNFLERSLCNGFCSQMQIYVCEVLDRVYNCLDRPELHYRDCWLVLPLYLTSQLHVCEEFAHIKSGWCWLFLKPLMKQV